MRYPRLLLLACLLFTLPAFGQALQTADCLGCHNDATLTKDVNGKQVSVFVDETKYQGSVHSVFECADCHGDIKEYPHEPAPKPVDCSMCHSEQVAAYEGGVHRKAREAGNGRAASCGDCHGNIHEVVPEDDPKSPMYHTNLPATCERCHAVKFTMASSGINTQPAISYEESVHGRAVKEGSMKAAVCTDCHGSHEIRPANDSRSSIFKFSVPDTCGKCHPTIAKDFKDSIHGQALRRGNWQSPVCTDCHGIHAIKAPIDPTSSVTAQTVARTTCAQCHGGVRLSEEFGVAGKRVSSYMDSYHGMASNLGSKVVANCASCHGVHNIYPSTDARSTISKGNLANTCGKCHPGADVNFTKGRIHLEETTPNLKGGMPSQADMSGVVIGWVRLAYLWLIFGTIGGMLFHNLIIWWKKAQAKRKATDRVIERLTLNQRIQHFFLLTSFIALVLTGFALKYPDSILGMILGSSESVRRIGHRIAAVVMLLTGVYHAFYLAATAEGRRAFIDMLPKVKDLWDVIGNMRYYLGLGKVKPELERFSYIEKAEYWALIWGTIVMGVTGLMAWFSVEISQFVPRWWIEVAIAIHFYEAILATLAIIVWHFYSVIFDPDAYPINWAWFDGRVSPEHMQHEHALAYREWLKSQSGETEWKEPSEKT